MDSSSSLSLRVLCTNTNPQISDSSSDIPSRSQSRLGFSSVLEHTAGGKGSSRTMKWTRSLFQRIFLDDDNHDKMDRVTSTDEALKTLPVLSIPSLEMENVCSTAGDSSSENEIERNILIFPPPPALRSSSFKPGETVVADNSLKPTCVIPNLCPSPQRPSRPLRTAELRHDYPHRGHSRSALMHQKWFWHARREEWTEWENHKEAIEPTAEAYDGITTMSPRRDDTSKCSAPSSTTSQYTLNVNAPIFPRTGDISALRDPYCASIDRCFCQFPLWTIHKSLFMFDLHHRASSLNDQTADAHVDSTEEEEHGAKSTSDNTPTLSRDSSSMTLNSGPTVISPALQEDDSVSADFSEDDFTLVEDDFSVSEKCGEDEDVNSDTDDSHGWEGVRVWELTWYTRWELLTELAKRHNSLVKPVTGSDSTVSDDSQRNARSLEKAHRPQTAI
jgi:hypothetical protein